MPWWEWALVSLGALLVFYALAVVVLMAAGRREDARGLAGFVPDCLILFRRLLADPRVPRRRKALVVALLGYLALPFDLVPDFLPVIGQLDDALLVVFVLRIIIRSGGPELLEEHWPGPARSLEALTRVAFGPKRASP